jgi:hypothetical protein
MEGPLRVVGHASISSEVKTDFAINLMPERPKLSERGADCCKIRDRKGSHDEIDSGIIVFHSVV